MKHDRPTVVRAANDYDDKERDGIVGESARKPPVATFEWLSTAQIFAPLPDPKLLVRGIQLGPGRPAMIAGYAWSMKSLATQSLALAVAGGFHLWGAPHFPCREGTVRHFDYEQGQHATLRRYQRLAIGISATAGAFGNRLAVTVFPRLFLNSRSAEDEYARACEGVDLAIVDAYRSSIPGMDENDSTAAEPLYMLGRVSEKTGTTFVVDHHAGKGERDDPRQAVRGTSAIFGACGLVLQLEAKKSGDPVKVMTTRGSLSAEGKVGEDFYLAAEDVEADGNPTAGVRIAYQTAEQAKSSAARPEEALDRTVDLVRECLRRNPGVAGTEALRELLGMGMPRVRAALQTLMARDEAVERFSIGPKGGKARRLYLATDAPSEAK